MGIWYCTREDVKAALDFKETARANSRIDRAIESASRSVEALTRRKFYPETGTRYFDWPDDQYSRSWRLWLDKDELISATAILSGGAEITPSQYFLEPANDGPPYDHVEINLDGPASFGGGGTHQRDVAITGVFGFRADSVPGGTLVEALDAVETDVDVSASAAVGVGSILNVGSERMVVTGRNYLDTAQNTTADLGASLAADGVGVASGAAFAVGETILVDTERMLILEIAGNTLIVKRAWDGSTLATHTSGSDVYAPRILTVTRGALGTAAGAHDSGAAFSVHSVPGPIKSLTVAEALVEMDNDRAAWAKSRGSGETLQSMSGDAIVRLRASVYAEYGRIRLGAV